MSAQKAVTLDPRSPVAWMLQGGARSELGDFDGAIQDLTKSLELDPGLTVQSCGSGAEGLAAAAAHPPDVILLDVMMPVMDGPTTLARLRTDPRTADIPVVFMTARVQKSDLDHLTSLGAIEVIAKPFEPTTLAASIRSLCGR